MLIDGEKYACEACVRGHRVSNCQHSNRPLQHINKKGRPVSQCAHCRSVRKSRAAHVKCDCGEKTSKCAHLQPTVEGHRETCCCNHGGRCTCALKKDPELYSDDSKSYAGSATTKVSVRRRRAATVHSSDPGGLSFDQLGHHKVSKLSRASQKSGPYTLNRVQSASGVCALGVSSDTLRLQDSADVAQISGPHERRQIKSETTSPLMSSHFAHHGINGLPRLDLGGISFPPLEYAEPLTSTSADWTYGESFGGMVGFGHSSEQLPQLISNTTPNSGEASEAEDFLPSERDRASSYSNNFLAHTMPNSMAAEFGTIDYSSFYKSDETSTVSSFVRDDPAFFLSDYNEVITTMDENSDLLGHFWEL